MVNGQCAPVHPSRRVLLFVAVTNPAASADRRFWVRRQWHRSMELMRRKAAAQGRDPARVVFKFVIGTEGVPTDVLRAVLTERDKHGDVALMNGPDFDAGQPASRSATTLKVMHAIRHATNEYAFDYFARVGDDAYFRVDLFAELAARHAFPKRRLYTGFRFHDCAIKETQSTHHYIVGMGFVLSHDMAQFVCRAHPFLMDGYPEDAVVGAWFVGTTAHVLHDARFHDISTDRSVAYAPCTNTSLLMHHMWSARDWDAIDEDGLLRC